MSDCSVCWESFDAAERKPKVLSCGHSVCAACIMDMVQENSVTCPQCRRVVSVQDLATNFSLLEVVEDKAPRQQREQSTLNASRSDSEAENPLFQLVENFQAELRRRGPAEAEIWALLWAHQPSEQQDPMKPRWSCCGRGLLNRECACG